MNIKRGKIRDLFRKTGNIKGAFLLKMDIIKDKNGQDLVDTEEIRKRWKEYTEELYKKDLNELDYYDGVSQSQSQTFWSVKSRSQVGLKKHCC